MLPDELTPALKARLNSICEARAENPEQVMKRFGIDSIKQGPSRISVHFKALQNTVFKDVGIRDGMAFVEMPNGRVFYGYRSMRSHRQQYELTHDLIDPKITEDTFLLAHDVAVRYATELNWPCAAVLPEHGGTIVECGVYLGHKSIRFIDNVIGQNGKLLAIEMMPDNVEILRRNVEENGLNDCIEIIHAGIWSGPGSKRVKGKGRQRNSLLTLENLDVDLHMDVKVDSLHSFLGQWDQPIADLIYMTINGAEVEALKGAFPSLDRIKHFFVNAPYAPNGKPHADLCRDLFRSNNCELIPTDLHKHIIAKSPYL